ncbi:hypothetical protein [Falsiroseomonas tokyonensis]|uniref:ABC-type transport auxiliary lipoprotein component domain-containing protein n=1 Tax=Falsiroseomonas tokyonensis TaxID=430521 RepID=A0ABV7BZS7_9PROT|nr:hypothetical protein [Falsiroseomonas tokyonensis]MBU8540757.1 hypothetical protein [Falsiroseomonas tokyonensis]
MLTRRHLSMLLPLGVVACAAREEALAPLPPLVTGYRHLTPLRLNVLEIEVGQPLPGAVQVAEPAPVRPEVEMRRMAEDRLVPIGTEGRARFLITNARFTRQTLAQSGGISAMFAGEPGERLAVELACRVEILAGDGTRVAFVEAQVQRVQTVADGASASTRRQAAEEVVRQAMEAMNVEFEFQLRRTLRAWLAEGVTPTAPAPVPVEREDLPGGAPRT